MTKPCRLSMFWLCCFVANFYTGKFQYNDHLATGIFLLFLVHKAKQIKARLQMTTEKKAHNISKDLQTNTMLKYLL